MFFKKKCYINKLIMPLFILCHLLIVSMQGIAMSSDSDKGKKAHLNVQRTVVSIPKAKQVPITLTEHGYTRIDPYHWMSQRDNPEILAYLAEENDYTAQKMKKAEGLEKTLFDEFKNRIKEDDNTVPYKEGDYFYYTRFEKNKNYPIYCRKKNNLDNPEEIILDVNFLAKGHDYFDVGRIQISPSQNLLAYCEDTVGRRKYTIKIKDLATGKNLSDALPNTTSNFKWANDSLHLFYTIPDPISLRAYRIYRHALGFTKQQDTFVYEEKDDTYRLILDKTKSEQYLLIGSIRKDSSEYRFLNANKPTEDFHVFAPRVDGREYSIDHYRDKFIIRTNDNAPNFKLMQCGLEKTDYSHWEDFIAYDPEVFCEKFQVFSHFIVVEERKAGLINLKVQSMDEEQKASIDHKVQSTNEKQKANLNRKAQLIDKKAHYYIQFAEPDYVAYMVHTPDMSSDELRYVYSSLKDPKSVFDYDLKTQTKVLKKQDEMLAGFKSDLYQTQRVFAIAEDGTSIPISLVFRTDKFKKGTNPLLLAGYGSYGMSYDAFFNPFVISLLDRGFVYAIAHVRGGGELGREWYYHGKMLNKKNTFTDFITSAEYLEKSGFAAPDKKYAMGESAGGLLIGAVINQRPDVFNAVIAGVPFVDMMNIMMDPSIPLTTCEYAEWGNPSEKQYYDYMLSYAPYDNVRAMAYPNILVVASYQDSQVQYWEAAKWVARLRALKTDDHLLLLRTRMKAGHGGASGRYERYQDIAFKYAFLLSL